MPLTDGFASPAVPVPDPLILNWSTKRVADSAFGVDETSGTPVAVCRQYTSLN
jgi:hypothetical protein